MAYTTINKSTDYFNTKLFTGTGSSNAVTGVGFQPDLTWIKNRSNTDSHSLYDAVRGVTKRLKSDSAGAETTQSNGLTAFGTDGFTVGDHSGVNGSGNAIVSWNWKANGAGSSNSDGSLSSTVSVNQTAGFSIVTYTGSSSASTVGHGLNAVPKMIITKTRASGYEWAVYHNAMGNEKHLLLDTNGAMGDGEYWNDTTPTSSVFSLGGQKINVNYSGQTYVAYCFAEKTGYSKFGSYVGNGNADGTFVYTGFKPAWVLTKAADATYQWYIFDNKRPENSNPNNTRLFAEANNGESTSTNTLNFLSNGFQITASDAQINGDGTIIAYLAIAEDPAKYAQGAGVELGTEKFLEKGAGETSYPEDNFKTVHWTGNGGFQTIDDVGFKPGFVWTQARSFGNYPQTFDSIRGVTKELEPATTSGEATNADSLTSFTDNGFILGSSNKLAFEASKKVSENTSHYNPLYIYGGVGMGKTHLLNSTGLALKETNKVMFISAERFMYQFVKCIKSNDMVKFKEYFRNADVFLIDDIQFMNGKEAMQEEFFHTFNALLDKGSQIIISADRPPNKLNKIQERIKSRFSGGLVIDIQQPDYDLRYKIIKLKTDELNKYYSGQISISDEIQKFISLELKNSIRELVGALNRIVSFSRIYNKVPNLSETKIVLLSLIHI